MNILATGFGYLNKYVRREVNYYMVKPTNALFFLTYRCTSRCKSCTMWKRKAQQRELSLDEWKMAVDELSGKGIVNVEMFGGDALLRKDVLIPLTAYTKQKGIPEADLVTNCNLMDRSTAEQLVEAGINTVYVSVDGVGSVQDAVRGVPESCWKIENTLEWIREARERLRTRKPKVVVNCTVSSLNLDGIEDVFAFADRAGADNVAFEYVGQFPPESLAGSVIDGIMPQPYYTMGERSILLNMDQARELKRKLKLIKTAARYVKVYCNTVNIDILSKENLTSGILPNKKCYVARYLVTIDPYGNVLPCPFYDSYSIGNIREKKLDEIWNNDKHKRFIKHIDSGGSRMCRHCILSVQRNPTIPQLLKRNYYEYTKKGVDQ